MPAESGDSVIRDARLPNGQRLEHGELRQMLDRGVRHAGARIEDQCFEFLRAGQMYDTRVGDPVLAQIERHQGREARNGLSPSSLTRDWRRSSLARFFSPASRSIPASSTPQRLSVRLRSVVMPARWTRPSPVTDVSRSKSCRKAEVLDVLQSLVADAEASHHGKVFDRQAFQLRQPGVGNAAILDGQAFQRGELLQCRNARVGDGGPADLQPLEVLKPLQMGQPCVADSRTSAQIDGAQPRESRESLDPLVREIVLDRATAAREPENP